MKRDEGWLSALGSLLSARATRLSVASVSICVLAVGAAFAAPIGARPAAESQEPRANSSERSEPYLLGPEDAVAIRVVGYEEFSGAATVRPDGRVSAPGLGEIPASGRSAEALARALATRLKRWVRDPIVTVTVTQFRSQGQIFVIGQVTRPSPYPFRQGLTVAEALALAGGPTLDADLANASLLRASGADGPLPGKGRTPVRVDLSPLAREGETPPHIVLNRGDMLVLPQARRARASILGDVQKPGSYDLTDRARVLEVFQLAQGPRPSANLKAATLTRGGKSTPIDLQALLRGGDTSLNVPLQDGDTIFVPENRMKVYVLGEVTKPDVVILPEGATLLDALAAAGGNTRDADLKQVRVARKGASGQPEVQTLDLTRLVTPGSNAKGRPKAILPPALVEGDLLFVPSRTRKKSVTDYVPFLYPVELLTRILGG